jgi:hypothetical protein
MTQFAKTENKFHITECPICYEEMKPETMVNELPCKHIVCDECMRLVRENPHDHVVRCPMCNIVVETSEIDDEPAPPEYITEDDFESPVSYRVITRMNQYYNRLGKLVQLQRRYKHMKFVRYFANYDCPFYAEDDE